MYTDVLHRIAGLLSQRRGPVVVVIDGPCASGKTSLAAAISLEHSSTVFSMDDFFLRPHQRTPARLSEAGGNVDYERFREEIPEGILPRGAGIYGSYDCQTGVVRETVVARLEQLVVVEGVYSMHPYFEGSRPDLCVFLDIEPQLQLERLGQRNPGLLQRFIDEWIPMENAYFDTYDIRGKADIIKRATRV